MRNILAYDLQSPEKPESLLGKRASEGPGREVFFSPFIGYITYCPCEYLLSVIVLTHLNCFNLYLINIPLLVYLISVFPFLCASLSLFFVSSVPAFTPDYAFAFSLLDCLPDLQLISCVPTYLQVKTILSTQTPVS